MHSDLFYKQSLYDRRTFGPTSELEHRHKIGEVRISSDVEVFQVTFVKEVAVTPFQLDPALPQTIGDLEIHLLIQGWVGVQSRPSCVTNLPTTCVIPGIGVLFCEPEPMLGQAHANFLPSRLGCDLKVVHISKGHRVHVTVMQKHA